MPRNPILTLAVAAVGVLALAGCAEEGGAGEPEGPMPAGGAAGGAASCIAAVTYDGQLYIQVDTDPVTAGAALDGAEVPPCDDTGSGEVAATPADAFAIEGVDPRYAVLSQGASGQMVYVVKQFAPGLTDAEPLPEDVADTLGVG